MTDPSSTVAPFTLTFRSEMDPLPGGSAAYATVVRVAGDTGRAVMSINRFHPDLPKPIGLFADKLAPEARDALASGVSAVKWPELPQPKRGDASGATLTIEYARGAQIIHRAFNSYDRERVQAIGPLLSAIEEVQAQLMNRPARALQLGITRTPGGFRVSWRNIGTGALLIADPREPLANGPSTRGQVKVTAVPTPRPGWDPPLPTSVTVDLAPAAGPAKPIPLAPGQTLELDTVPWKPDVLGDHVAKASWIDYLGPAVDPATVMDVVPEPNQADDGRPYRLRGGAFSNGIGFKVEKGR
jgi:hypothetical protein